MAIQFSVRATGNQYHRLALSKVKDEILEGSSVEEALKNTDLFNRMELLRIGLAEKSGTLPKTFESLKLIPLILYFFIYLFKIFSPFR